MRSSFLLLIVIPVAFFALVAQPAAAAAQLKPSSVTITAVVNGNGVADVREDYLFILRDQNELNAFESLVQTAGYSFQLWIASVPGVDFHLGRSYSELSNVVLYTQKVSNNVYRLTVRYVVPVAVLVGEKPTELVYLLNRFHFPRGPGGTYELPAGYSVEIVLPSNAKILSYAPQTESALRSTNIVSWEGPMSTNQWFIKYAIPRPVAAPSLVSFLTRPGYGFYFGAVMVILALALFWKREYFKQMIKRYVEENSAFEE